MLFLIKIIPKANVIRELRNKFLFIWYIIIINELNMIINYYLKEIGICIIKGINDKNNHKELKLFEKWKTNYDNE